MSLFLCAKSLSTERNQPSISAHWQSLGSLETRRLFSSTCTPRRRFVRLGVEDAPLPCVSLLCLLVGERPLILSTAASSSLVVPLQLASAPAASSRLLVMWTAASRATAAGRRTIGSTVRPLHTPSNVLAAAAAAAQPAAAASSAVPPASSSSPSSSFTSGSTVRFPPSKAYLARLAAAAAKANAPPRVPKVPLREPRHFALRTAETRASGKQQVAQAPERKEGQVPWKVSCGSRQRWD
jgi:hypothetical protein